MAVHFVGFKHPNIGVDQRYDRAVTYFGKPDFIHRYWDARAQAEVFAGDVVIFTNQAFVVYTFDDSAYQ